MAEAGEGLAGCATGVQCAGATGAVYRVKGAVKGRVVTGLSSVAAGPPTAPRSTPAAPSRPRPIRPTATPSSAASAATATPRRAPRSA
ncbi:hypothetical protein NKH18_02135 [Streptomyces sp. M10(2022)]